MLPAKWRSSGCGRLATMALGPKKTPPLTVRSSLLSSTRKSRAWPTSTPSSSSEITLHGSHSLIPTSQQAHLRSCRGQSKTTIWDLTRKRSRRNQPNLCLLVSKSQWMRSCDRRSPRRPFRWVTEYAQYLKASLCQPGTDLPRQGIHLGRTKLLAAKGYDAG